MAKDDRLYAKFDINMDENAKIILLSDAAFRALIESTMYCRRQLTDGFLADRVVSKKWGAEVAAELSENHPDRPSWVRVEGGWQIWDFSEHQTTNADIETKRAAGKLGGEARAKRFAEARAKHESSKPVAPATEVLKQKASMTLAKTETETETETETDKKNKDLVQDKPAHALESEFEQWWEYCWRKQAKPDAFKAFKAARKTTSVEALIAGRDAYKLLNAGQAKDKLKMPAGWLRDRRWEDEQIAYVPPVIPGGLEPARPRAAVFEECPKHPNYPKGDWMNPCDACKRDLQEAEARREGREF